MGLQLKYSTTYPIASGGTVRAGTIGLRFSNAGNARYITAAGDNCQIQAVAGQEIETGLLSAVVQAPSQTIALVGR